MRDSNSTSAGGGERERGRGGRRRREGRENKGKWKRGKERWRGGCTQYCPDRDIRLPFRQAREQSQRTQLLFQLERSVQSNILRHRLGYQLLHSLQDEAQSISGYAAMDTINPYYSHSLGTQRVKCVLKLTLSTHTALGHKGLNVF